MRPGRRPGQHNEVYSYRAGLDHLESCGGADGTGTRRISEMTARTAPPRSIKASTARFGQSSAKYRRFVALTVGPCIG
jgi:hypothetical protein